MFEPTSMCSKSECLTLRWLQMPGLSSQPTGKWRSPQTLKHNSLPHPRSVWNVQGRPRTQACLWAGSRTSVSLERLVRTILSFFLSISLENLCTAINLAKVAIIGQVKKDIKCMTIVGKCRLSCAIQFNLVGSL